MNLLQSVLNSSLLLFPLRTGLILSTLLSTASFADNAPPLVSKGQTSKNTISTMTARSPQYSQTQAPIYYYSPQQQQYYQAVPYYYYYPQPQHPSVYTPRQWSNYPQTRPSPNSPVINTTPNNSVTTHYPMRKKIKKEKHAWGDKRHIWPDFYTGFTEEAWDKMINAPYDAGRMPGGWRAPSLSTPDPVTVSDAVANQMPPIMEEMGNMTNFSN
jgi:hypothetical protein